MHYHLSNPLTVAQLLIWGPVLLAGCASTGQRNIREALVVTAPVSLRENEVDFALELRDERKSFTLDQVDDFLASDDAADLSGRMRKLIRTRAGKVNSTIDDARKRLSDGLAIVRPDADGPERSDNFVVYIENDDRVRLLFARDEIERIFSLRELADDMSTLRYTHPGFDQASLRALHDRAAAMNLGVGGLSPSQREMRKLKDEAATRVLERTLRGRGVALSNEPLLVTGTLRAAASPKLSEALHDRDVFEGLIKSENPDALRALVYVVDRDIVDLDHP